MCENKMGLRGKKLSQQPITTGKPSKHLTKQLFTMKSQSDKKLHFLKLFYVALQEL